MAARDPDPSGRTAPPATGPAPVAPSAFNLAAVAMAVAGAALLAWLAWIYYVDTPWTRDASVRVYTAQVAPEVSGRVTAVPVADNQAVRKGDLLFRIDDRDYRIAVQRAQAARDRAEAQRANTRAEADRREKLSDLAVSAEVRQTYESNAQAAQAAYEGAMADLAAATLNLERTEIRSPVNGYVTNLLLQAGTYATAGQAAMTLVDSDSYWVAGYFEETQLRRIRLNDPAEIRLMGYPDRPLAGRVESIARGIQDPNASPGVAGLPSVNPVFTWVRLAQRIPVRIRIEQLPDEVHLAAGMTATVHVRPDGPAAPALAERSGAGR
ncbi:efflux RND transporter periplasmic adaptor subunit [Methylobacterium isbiliense]|jgi:multidrug resistance efflux pump|uniref:p-hydroxybenzoic acid efflux pump subunit AaeA n=1 Tax=Methylobacterium isbiliense TaxID=315478 RepID=A0ABQ4SH58_9HYPH|nr:HlyD family secretion protein [Methylobacterium isbiliense]MDN3625812.1 HlyD family secretion protein [Methylobacterium isbiliense]GJE02562.1 p-hydroxybenzoic acid efflux pump subunit AaeA [Methylobacterium isbiliense]